MELVLRIVCAVGDADHVTDQLWLLGATGVAEQAIDDDQAELLAGFGDGDLASVVTDIADALGDLASVAPAPDRSTTWREHATPHRVGPFWLRLPEHAIGPDDSIDICIEPGGAFGSGSHETTRLALAAIAAADRGGARVADIGCGTGVLAIAAAAVGARHVCAVDIDNEAVQLTRTNAFANAVDVAVTQGSVDELAGSTFDLVIANVTLGVQRELAEPLADLVRPGGDLILTGILGDQMHELIGLHPTLEFVARTIDREWICLVLHNPVDPGPDPLH